MKVTVNASLIPKKPNTPLDYRCRIYSDGTVIDIKNKIIELGNPFEGQIVYDKPFDKYYTVTKVELDDNLNTTIEVKEFGNITVATEQDILNLF